MVGVRYASGLIESRFLKNLRKYLLNDRYLILHVFVFIFVFISANHYVTTPILCGAYRMYDVHFLHFVTFDC